MNTETALKSPRFKAIKFVFQMSADPSSNVTLTLTHGRKGYVVFAMYGTRRVELSERPFLTLDAAKKCYATEFTALSVKAAEAGFPVEYKREKTGRKIPCPGEAHSNPHIDHCMVCLPGWGEIDELAPVDLEAAKNARQDIPVGILSTEQYQMMKAREDAGEVEMVGVSRRSAWYNVYRWTGK
jgi:hypothetical protein